MWHHRRKFRRFVIVIFSALVFVSSCRDNEPTTVEESSESAKQAGMEGRSSSSDKYRLSVDPKTIRRGETHRVNVDIVPKKGLKVNLEYPWRVGLKGGSAFSISETKFDKSAMTLDKNRASLETFIRANQAGTHAVKVEADFSVCNESRCYRISKEALSLNLEVTGSEN